MGPGLSTPRANVSVVIYTNRVFAVGGFSGRMFLDTMEYLHPDNSEWCSYLSVEDSGIAQKHSEKVQKHSQSKRKDNVVDRPSSDVPNGN